MMKGSERIIQVGRMHFSDLIIELGFPAKLYNGCLRRNTFKMPRKDGRVYQRSA
jgi:hypothetical protein